MESFQYFVAKTDKYTLFRKIGGRVIPIITDINAIPICSIYQKICEKKYTSEKELFDDIYKQYSRKSIVGLFRN